MKRKCDREVIGTLIMMLGIIGVMASGAVFAFTRLIEPSAWFLFSGIALLGIGKQIQ